MKLNFQIIILIVFIVFAVIAILVFSGAFGSGGGSSTTDTELVMWGSYPTKIIKPLLSDAANAGELASKVMYVEKQASTIRAELVEALARGAGPDLVILPYEYILLDSNKFYELPSESFPERSFRDAYVDANLNLLTDTGTLAFPIAIDPLVMYWNKSIFASAGIASPPTTWNQLTSLNDELTNSDDRGNISRSLVALGTYQNIANAKSILSAIIMQTGDDIIKSSPAEVVLGDVSGADPAGALRFYTSFADSNKTTYSWNSSLPNSLDAFAAEKLALFFGFASDANEIRSRNPNLNFDVELLPQIQNASARLTFGQPIAIAVLAKSTNAGAAFSAAGKLSLGSFAEKFSEASSLAPARRDLLGASPSDPAAAIFNESAIMARAWYDFAPASTATIFKEMIESVIFGRESPSSAVDRAGRALSGLLQNYQNQ